MVYALIICFILNDNIFALPEEQKLSEIFPEDYNKYQPPWTTEDPAHVYLQLSVMDVDKIDEGAMEYSLQCYLGEFWRDHRLNLSVYLSKIDAYFTFPTHLTEYMWVPDLVFDNTKKGMVFPLSQANRIIRLMQDGTFLRSTRYTLIVGCQMDFRFYPIDIQHCFMKIASMANSDLKLLLHWAEEIPSKNQRSIILTEDIQPLTYILQKPESYKNTEVWTSGSYTYLYANFTFVRRVSGSVFNIYIPSTLVVFLSWISFWLDTEAVPARVTLGVTSLLTLATQMVQAHTRLPPISYMTAMDIWLFACLITVFSSLVEFAISYHLFITNSQKLFVNRTAKSVASIMPEKSKTDILILTSGVRQNCTTERTSCKDSIKSESVPPFRNRKISMDCISRKLFPVGFFIFAVVYWTYYFTR